MVELQDWGFTPYVIVVSNKSIKTNGIYCGLKNLHIQETKIKKKSVDIKAQIVYNSKMI